MIIRLFQFPCLLLSLVFAAGAVTAQSAARDCFEVKYLDLFGLDSKELHWPDSEVDGLLDLVGKKDLNHNFLIPAIVKQLADFHPCRKNLEYNRDRFVKLVNLYVSIRGKSIEFVRSYSFTTQQIEAITKDFYVQILSDRVLPSLIYTMDDGPLQGEIVKDLPRSRPTKTVSMPFGEIRFIVATERLYAIAVNKSGRVLWARILKGTNPDRHLSRLSPGPIAVNTYEAVVVVSPFVDGERLSVYMRPNGSFVYYTHSW